MLLILSPIKCFLNFTRVILLKCRSEEMSLLELISFNISQFPVRLHGRQGPLLLFLWNKIIFHFIVSNSLSPPLPNIYIILSHLTDCEYAIPSTALMCNSQFWHHLDPMNPERSHHWSNKVVPHTKWKNYIPLLI